MSSRCGGPHQTLNARFLLDFTAQNAERRPHHEGGAFPLNGSSEVRQVVKRFTHARVREDEVAQERVLLSRLHGHCYGVDDFPGLRSKKRAAQNLLGVSIHHDLKEPFGLIERSGTRDCRYGQGVDLNVPP